jgi:asparagine synthase (glutamine-hydrolysing)
MCGIVGTWTVGSSKSSADDLNRVISRMASTISYRGPDDQGTWVDPLLGLALGHRRLAILDLSPAGHQPMRSFSNRFIISYNGEIYNHMEIRNELAKEGLPKWRSQSDTETLLTAIEYWGVERTLNLCVGLFAFALWDRGGRTLTLARDRLGEKPLYYGWVGGREQGAFVFASELSAIRAYPSFNAPVSRVALSQYLRFTYVPAPLSIYDGIFKLEPGCMLTIEGAPSKLVSTHPIAVGERYERMEIRSWRSMKDTVIKIKPNSIGSESAAVNALELTLLKAVEAQSLADVPLGAFLSGGVDSSAIVALLQSQCSQRVKTFTMGFDEAGFDESPHARKVANHLGTDHHEVRVSSKMVQDVIPSLPWIYDEPFADSSQIPTHLVCKAARRHVTVALSGDGGDELFGGYNRYFWGPRVWNRLSWLPFPLRRLLGVAVRAIPPEAWDRASVITSVSRLGDKVHKLGARLSSVKSMDDLYWSLVSEWDPATVVKGISHVSPSPWESNEALPQGLNPVERMMFRDAVTYLPDDILCKVDRAAMACSLETRVPFLDHRVVELAWRLPLNMKIRGKTGKWILRQVLYKYVPKELIERPKAGFAIPIGQWLRGPLRDWAECLLGESRLSQEGYFHPEPIRNAWAEHLTGRRDHTPKIWTILMFQAWLEAQQK